MTATVGGLETIRSADGTTIAFQRLGRGPAVVALHGGLGTAASWRTVAERLADRYEFLLVDRRGRGGSDNGPEPHSLAAEVGDARAVLRAAAHGAVLLGHSYGGAVALEAARLAAPGELAAVEVYEPAVGVGGLIGADELDRIDELNRAGEPNAALEHGFTQLDAAGLVARAPLPPGARRPQALLDMAWTVSRELRAVDALGSDLSRYAGLDLPVLVLAGESSPPRQRQLCQQLADTLPHGRITWLPALGHVAHTAAPDVVAAALAPFLDMAGGAGDTST
jgi:pimeloyl-ACP methyl ester carboxylesterase